MEEQSKVIRSFIIRTKKRPQQSENFFISATHQRLDRKHFQITYIDPHPGTLVDNS